VHNLLRDSRKYHKNVIHGKPCPSYREDKRQWSQSKGHAWHKKSPLISKEENKLKHNNLTSNFGLWNSYRRPHEEHTHTSVSHAPFTQCLNILSSKLWILLALQSFPSSVSVQLLLLIVPAYEYYTTHNFSSSAGKRMETSAGISLL
jgi:hypothetical protein